MKDIEEFHGQCMADKAERARSLFAEDGDEGWRGGGDRPQAVPAAQFDRLVEGNLSTGFDTADQPSRVEVRAALREAARAAVAGLVAAPSSNTGHKFTVHWAEVTVFASIETVADLVAMAFIEDFTPFGESGLDRFEECGPIKWYGRSFRGPGGIFLKADPTAPGMRPHCCVVLPGGSFDLYGMVPFAHLLAAVEDRGDAWHCTRLDLAFDGVPFSPRDFFDEVSAGNLRSLVQRNTLQWHETPFGERKGTTATLGKRGRGHFVRVYDERPTGPRFEDEIRGRRAKALGWMLVDLPVTKWHLLALGAIRDNLDLVDRSESVNVSRCGLRPLWKSFVGEVERLKVSLGDGLGALKDAVVAVEDKVLRVAQAVKRRVAKLFLLGGESFLAEIKRSVILLTPSDLSEVADWKAAINEAVQVLPSLVDSVRAAVGVVCVT